MADKGVVFVPFTAQTRMSGVDLNGRRVRKGAGDAVVKYVAANGGSVSPELYPILDRISRAGGTPLVVAEATRVLGVVYLKDIVKGGIRERFQALRAMGIRTVMITGDNPLTAASIANEAGVDDFLAEATPEDKMTLIRREQQDGKLVAMTGDGTNDAPALAQADVGVAMNTGTQAAKEAGNMVDLDSSPTKLLDIVEIGKQLLMTRGALTTFSIANDVAKYFAIIPAMFAVAFPVLSALNIMHLQTPESAILSAVIFNAVIIVALVPLALRGVSYRAMSAEALLRRNLLIYGVGGLVVPFVGIKIIDVIIARNLLVAVLMTIVTTVLLGLVYPLVVTALAQLMFPDQASGQLVIRDGTIIGSRLIGQTFVSPGYFRSRPSAAGSGYDAANSGGTNLGPTNRKLVDAVAAAVDRAREENPNTPVPADLVTASGSGLDPHLSPAAVLFQVRRVARERRVPEASVRAVVEAHIEARQFGFLGEPRVNVLLLNLALDEKWPLPKPSSHD
jgi:K+-transporting ATPase KdpC subunit